MDNLTQVRYIPELNVFYSLKRYRNTIESHNSGYLLTIFETLVGSINSKENVRGDIIIGSYFSERDYTKYVTIIGSPAACLTFFPLYGSIEYKLNEEGIWARHGNPLVVTKYNRRLSSLSERVPGCLFQEEVPKGFHPLVKACLFFEEMPSELEKISEIAPPGFEPGSQAPKACILGR